MEHDCLQFRSQLQVFKKIWTFFLALKIIFKNNKSNLKKVKYKHCAIFWKSINQNIIIFLYPQLFIIGRVEIICLYLNMLIKYRDTYKMEPSKSPQLASRTQWTEWASLLALIAVLLNKTCAEVKQRKARVVLTRVDKWPRGEWGSTHSKQKWTRFQREMRSQKKCRTTPPESSFTGAAGTGASGRERAAPLFPWEACRATPAGSGARRGMCSQQVSCIWQLIVPLFPPNWTSTPRRLLSNRLSNLRDVTFRQVECFLHNSNGQMSSSTYLHEYIMKHL